MADGLLYTTFNLAHYLLAVEYHGIATHVPEILDRKPPTNQSTCAKVFHWFMLISNALSGVAYGFACAFFYLNLLTQAEQPSKALKTAKITISYWLAFCAFTSGILLVSGVIKIRRFFKDHD